MINHHHPQFPNLYHSWFSCKFQLFWKKSQVQAVEHIYLVCMKWCNQPPTQWEKAPVHMHFVTSWDQQMRLWALCHSFERRWLEPPTSTIKWPRMYSSNHLKVGGFCWRSVSFQKCQSSKSNWQFEGTHRAETRKSCVSSTHYHLIVSWRSTVVLLRWCTLFLGWHSSCLECPWTRSLSQESITLQRRQRRSEGVPCRGTWRVCAWTSSLKPWSLF